MSNFIENLVARHTDSVAFVQPRLRSVFEHTNTMGSAFIRDTFGVENDQNVGINDPTPDITDTPNFLGNNISKNSDFSETPPSSQIRMSQSKQPQPFETENLTFIMPNGKSNLLNIDVLEKGKQVIDKETIYNEKTANPQSNEISPSSVVKPIFSGARDRPSVPTINEFTTKNNEVVRENGAWLKDVKKISEPFFEPPQAPVIKVNIGRIEIRAMPTASTQPPSRNQVVSKPQMSLDDYLKQQNDSSK